MEKDFKDQSQNEILLTEEKLNTSPHGETDQPMDFSADTEGDTNDTPENVEIPISALDLDDEIKRKHTNTAQKKKKKKWSFLLFLAVNVIVIGITAMFEFTGEKSDDASTVADILNSLSHYWYYLIFAFLCFFGIYLFQAIKISRMLKVTTGKRRYKTTFVSVIIGKYYDNITPLAMGGQPFQAYFLTKNKVPAGTATAAPIVQLFLGTCGFLTLALVAFIFFGYAVESTLIRVCAYIGFGINCLTPLAILFFSLFPKITTRIVSGCIKLLAKIHIIKDYETTLNKAIQTVVDYRTSIIFMWRSKSTMIIGYLLSVLEKLSEVSITFFVMMACFEGSANYLEITAITLFIYSATSFVPTPGTAGASEGSFFIVFQSFLPMLIWRLFCYYSFLFFGFITVITNSLKNRAAVKKS